MLSSRSAHAQAHAQLTLKLMLKLMLSSRSAHAQVMLSSCSSLKKRKITKHPCYSLSNSVFVGVQLTGKSSQEIEDVISTKFSVDVSHVLKTLDYSYGNAQ
ncbi:hypothetical protein RhiirC2_772741 [Rhizophagus irregularis]|uniref:Uncharacterized protein n=1 Tax=Rhizophagus irregularis TaxID=588596 RepID=A0A2N1NQP5_9GLOM|nr:hypothetical protein RhiirC2_772741 [Rhizophagus irregularis]